jgi:glyoxylase-like metal-dependent hydrolase (beta-lactamase superfamily II)
MRRVVAASCGVGIAWWMVALAVCAEEAAAPQHERISELLTRGSQLAAKPVAPDIWVVSGNSNVYLVNTHEGAVLIDTGLASEAGRIRELLRAAVPDLRLRAIVLTHAHPDHVGGVSLWRSIGVAVIAHRAFEARNRDQVRLGPFRDRRARVLWAEVMPEDPGLRGPPYTEIDSDIHVDDQYSFHVGGISFQVLATPGAEGPDAVSVWLPARKVLFTGDALGPAAGSFPNLFTLRGENLRPAVPMLETLEKMRALRPKLLLPGHFEPIEGAQEIDALLVRTAAAVRYVHDATVAGMNRGADLWTLMDEIRLPPELALSEQYGRVAWGVRAIWEGYTGWFRYESTTELFAVPPPAVYAELAELAGGPQPLAERAIVHVLAGEPLQALHLTEVALAADPHHVGALEAQLAALERLAEADGGANFQVSGWLRHEIERTRSALAEATAGGGGATEAERATVGP